MPRRALVLVVFAVADCGAVNHHVHAREETAAQLGCAINSVGIYGDSRVGRFEEWTASCGGGPLYRCTHDSDGVDTLCNPVAGSASPAPAPAPAVAATTTVTPASASVSAPPSNGTTPVASTLVAATSETAGAAARNRAAVEFSCDAAAVTLTPILRQTGATTFSIQACGHRAVYTCRAGSEGGDDVNNTQAFCVREPDVSETPTR